MMPSRGEMRHRAIHNNMWVMLKLFMWKERRGFPNGPIFLENLFIEWKSVEYTT